MHISEKNFQNIMKIKKYQTFSKLSVPQPPPFSCKPCLKSLKFVNWRLIFSQISCKHKYQNVSTVQLLSDIDHLTAFLNHNGKS